MAHNSESRRLFLGLDTPRDRLRIARKDADDYLEDPLNVEKAEAFARSAHLLADWVLPNLGYKADEIYRICPNLKAIRDFSNLAKHGGKLDRKPYLRKGEQRGGFSRAFSRDFQWARLQLYLEDGTVVNYEDVVEEVIRFWEGLFAQHDL